MFAPATLQSAWAQVAANEGAAGVDRQTIEMIEHDLEANLRKLHEELKAGRYQPKPVKRVYIPKPGGKGEKRPLGIPTVRDRIAQGALKKVLEPIFEHGFASQSYGFRPGRGCKDALRRVDELLKGGHTWVVDADLKSYFDTIPHELLMERVREKVADGRILELIELFLNQAIMEELKEWVPEEGTPQGAVLSPLLSNIYLDPLDHQMALEGFEMVRYADDFVIVCRSEADAQRALERVQQWVEQAGLTLHPEKTKIVNAAEPGGFDFLGYHFERNMKWPRKKSLEKLKATIRSKTKRNNGHSLEQIIKTINPTLRGWFEYFKHSRRTAFPRIDGWIRMRLRSILRKRQHRRGRGAGWDHRRWPNAFFAEHGLLSLTATHVLACQSSRK